MPIGPTADASDVVPGLCPGTRQLDAPSRGAAAYFSPGRKPLGSMHRSGSPGGATSGRELPSPCNSWTRTIAGFVPLLRYAAPLGLSAFGSLDQWLTPLAKLFRPLYVQKTVVQRC